MNRKGLRKRRSLRVKDFLKELYLYNIVIDSNKNIVSVYKMQQSFQ